MAAGFLVGGFVAGAFFVGAFLAAGSLAAAFFVGAFLVGAFFAVVFFDADFLAGVLGVSLMASPCHGDPIRDRHDAATARLAPWPTDVSSTTRTRHRCGRSSA